MTTWTNVSKSSASTPEVDFLFSDGLDFLFSDGTDYVFVEGSTGQVWTDGTKHSASWSSSLKNSASWTSPSKS